MAVTVISKPSATLMQTASYEIPVVLSSDKVGTTGIDQHKFYIEFIIEGVSIGRKYFVVLTGNQAQANIGPIVKSYITIPAQFDHPVEGIINIPQLNQYPEILPVYPLDVVNVTCNIGESYYDAGVYVENAGTPFSFTASRGFSTAHPDWNEANFTDVEVQSTPATYFLPFSGQDFRSFAFNVQRFYTTPADIYFLFNFYATVGGVESLVFTKEISAAVFDWVVYLPMFFAGFTDQPNFSNLRIEIKNDSTSPATTTVYNYNFPRTIEYCGEKMISLMFEDIFYEWQFLSFPMKSYVSISKQKEVFEGAETGRFDFNRKAIQSYRINTDLLTEDQNRFYEGLFLSNEIYIIGNSYDISQLGTVPAYELLTRVSLTETLFNVKSIRSNKLVQYQFTIQESLNKFIP